MASAYKCDLSGKLCEGEGLKRMDVQITPTLRLEIVPHNKVSERQYGQGVLAPEAAARIEKALKAEFAAEWPPAVEKK